MIKSAIATVLAGASLFAAPARADIYQATKLVQTGNFKMNQAVHLIKSGNKAEACRWIQESADSYASAYVLYMDREIMDLMLAATTTHTKYC